MANDVNTNIKTTADTSAIKKTAAEVNNLSRTAKTAEASANASAGAFNTLATAATRVSRAVGLINKAMTGFGIVGMIMMAINAVKSLYEWVNNKLTEGARKANEAFKKLAETLNLKSLDKISEKNKAIAKSFKDVAEAIEDVNDKLAHQNDLQDMRDRNADTIEKANRDIARRSELSQTGDEGKRAEINERYDRQEVEANLAIAKRDIVKRADRAYNENIASNYTKQYSAIDSAKLSQKASIVAAESIVNNLKVVAKKGNLTDEEKTKNSAELKKAEERLLEEKEKLVDLEKRKAILEREETQAIEKRNQELKAIAVAEQSAEAQRAQLDDAHNQRYYEQEKNKMVTVTEKSSVVTEGVKDRISQLGGFSTIGAKNAAGVVVQTETQKQVKQSELQTKELQKQTTTLEKISKNTENSSGATFT